MSMHQSQEDLIEQAKVEARAKIIWGDSPKEVILFLRTRGLTLEEAMDVTDAAFAERRAELRMKALKQVFLGLILLPLPFFGYLFYNILGDMSFIGMITFGLACAAALFGLYLFFSGIVTILFPKSEQGDPNDDSI